MSFKKITEEQINEVLTNPISKHRVFEKMQVRELCDIMEFCKRNFKTDKGNWSINLAVLFCEKFKKLPLGLYQNLTYFYIQYAKRKKVDKGFNTFRERLYHYTLTKGILKRNLNKPTLLDNSKIKPFLTELKHIKFKYLNCTDDLFLKTIKECIDTGFEFSTLKSYYYNNEKNKNPIQKK